MRLCQVVEAAAGGTGRHVIELTRGLAARGHDLTLIYSPLRIDALFAEGLSAIAAKLVPLAIPRGVGWNDLGAARGLGRLIRDRGPFAVVHGHSSKAGVVTRIADVAGAARVYTPHALRTLDPGLGRVARSGIGLAERWLGGRRTDALIAVSGAEWVEAGRLGIGEARRHLIPNRLSGYEHRPRDIAREALGAGEGELWLGFVGRLCAQKAPLEFVGAAIGAMRRCAAVRALIVGDGEHAPLVEQAIAASGFAERFEWKREVDAREWIAAIDLLVVTSRYEGLPYAMLEALAAGVPILSTPVGGAAELLGGGAGVVAAGEALPGRLLALTADPVALGRLRAGAANAGEACRGEQMIDRTEALYRRVARAA
jgi:glycosyltransferase involved in cell wall biosynthesis